MPAFATDFSAVQTHLPAEADSIGARAYAGGADVAFGAGAFDAGAGAGQALLGHELAHVVQQRQGRVAAPAGVPSGAPFAHYAD